MNEVQGLAGYSYVKDRGYFGAVKHFIVYYKKGIVGAFAVPLYIAPYFTLLSPQMFKAVTIEANADGSRNPSLVRLDFEFGYVSFSVGCGHRFYLNLEPDEHRWLGGWGPFSVIYTGGSLGICESSVKRLDRSVGVALLRDGRQAAQLFEDALRKHGGDVSQVSSSLFVNTIPVEELHLEDYFSEDPLENFLMHVERIGLLSLADAMSFPPFGELYREHLLKVYGESGKVCRYRYFNRELLSLYKNNDELFYVDNCIGNKVYHPSSFFGYYDAFFCLFWKSFYNNIKAIGGVRG